ncbi:MAG: response regulator [Candidatus Anammoxibacter sp.]
MENDEQLTILVIDDSPEDIEAINRYLSKPGENRYKVFEAETGEDGLETLKNCNPDCVLIDYRLPDTDGVSFIKEMAQDLKTKDIPVILLTGQGNETVAAASLKSGATDYLVKGNVNSDNLTRSIRYSIEKRAAAVAQDKLVKELQKALAEVKTLSGFIPICASCKNIRDDKGYWNKVEQYINKHSEAEFTHSMCPDCLKKWYPQLYKD